MVVTGKTEATAIGMTANLHEEWNLFILYRCNDRNIPVQPGQDGVAKILLPGGFQKSNLIKSQNTAFRDREQKLWCKTVKSTGYRVRFVVDVISY